MRFGILRFGAIVLAAVLAVASTGLGDDDLSIEGYYKNFFVVFDPHDIKDLSPLIETPPMGSVSGRIRLNGHWRINDRLGLTSSYDFAPRVQDRALFFGRPTMSSIDPLSYRVTDLDSRLYPSKNSDIASFGIFQNLDRLYLTVNSELADIYVGRQAIAFGSARIINPTDIIAPYSYETLDTEDRVGVDAVRARIPLGFMGEIDAGYVFGDDFEFDRSAMFLRGKFYVARTDLSVIAIGFRENVMVGFDMARSIGGAGFWLEAAHTFADAMADERQANAKDYFRASVGLDYSFGNNTYTFVEYHFNQAGSDSSDDYLTQSVRTAYTDGSVYLLGRHYVTPGVSFEITPLITGMAELLVNVSDRSAFLSPTVEYNVAENIYIAAGAFVGIGKRQESVFKLRSEFGSYPDIFFSSFRVYF